MKATNFIYFAALCLAAASIATSHAVKGVTAAQVNGTWKTKNGEFQIWALGKQRLQVAFSGVYNYKTPQGPSANEGEGSGIATIEGDTAIFKPEGAEEECQITLKYRWQTGRYANRDLRIRPQCERRGYLQKSFV
jgi:hypothetical protein